MLAGLNERTFAFKTFKLLCAKIWDEGSSGSLHLHMLLTLHTRSPEKFLLMNQLN
jgi:hypothetical protein